MTSFYSESDELPGMLLAAVEATVRREADQASICRTITRAIELAPASKGASGEFERVTVANADASRFEKRTLIASWSSVAAAAVCLAVGLSLTLDNPQAFAQVQEQLAKVRTIRFVFRSGDPAKQDPGRVFFVGSDRYREELPDGRVIVTDLRDKQVMELDTRTKTGEIYPLYDVADREKRVAATIAMLRNAPAESVKNIGRRRLDEHDVTDYLVVDGDGRTLKVSVDTARNLPVRIEWLSTRDEALSIATQFEFDQPIDEALVTIAAPDGYQVTQINAAARPKRDELVVSSAGLGPVKWGMTKADVIHLLGEPDGIKKHADPGVVHRFTPQFLQGKQGQWAPKTGEELIYDSRGFRIFVNTDEGVETIDCYADGKLGNRVRGFTGETDKRIQMGATPDDIARFYGEPDLSHGLTVDLPNGNWEYFKEGLTFGFFDNVVSHIQIQAPHLRPGNTGKMAVPVPQ